jgi:hypothetical protein
VFSVDLHDSGFNRLILINVQKWSDISDVRIPVIIFEVEEFDKM